MNNNIYLQSLKEIEEIRDLLNNQENAITNACATVGYYFILFMLMLILFIWKNGQYKKKVKENSRLRKELEEASSSTEEEA